MSKCIYLIADFFYRDFTGGAELNDYSLAEHFRARGFKVHEVYCKDATIEFFEKHKDENFIVANFVSLAENSKKYMIENLSYIIYEHDHKYLKKRNPIFYKDFKAPKQDLANIDFFKAAKATICLTNLATDVFVKNTELTNVDKVGASVWRSEDLDYLKELNNSAVKNGKAAIMDSPNPIKKRHQCIAYCEKNNIEYDLISHKNHREFLKILSQYSQLIFMTGHLETCCRLIVEAKMLNCAVTTQKILIGACSEEWFSLNGEPLIEEIRKISLNSVDVFMRHFND